MSTLGEIEQAVMELPVAQQEALRRFLDACLMGANPARPQTDLREFSGSILLPHDPLQWQHQVREEWV